MEPAPALSCPGCEAPVDPANIHQELSLASCGRCEAVFSLDEAAAEPPAAAESPAAEPPAAPEPSDGVLEAWANQPPRSGLDALQGDALPTGVEVAEGPEGLVIVHRWLNYTHFFLAFFALFWNGFLVLWWMVAITNREWGMLPFTLLHVAAGVVIGYTALTGFLNRTVLTVSSGQLKVEHLPLWWPGGQVLPTAELKQLYCREHVQRSKNGTQITYSVEAVARDGLPVRVIGGLRHLEVARFMERRIEDHLGIVDVPMPMEVSKHRW